MIIEAIGGVGAVVALLILAATCAWGAQSNKHMREQFELQAKATRALAMEMELFRLNGFPGSLRREYATRYMGGGMMVRPNDPEIEEIYPLDRWIEAERRGGAHIYTRMVQVIEDWRDVQDADAAP